MKNVSIDPNSKSWLSNKLILEVRKVFESRYKRNLTDNEVYEIAENLTGVIETFLKFKWRQKYRKDIR